MNKNTLTEPETVFAGDLVRGGKWVEVEVEIAKVSPPGKFKFSNGKTVDRPCIEFTSSPNEGTIPGRENAIRFVPCSTQVLLLRFMWDSASAADWVGRKIKLYVARVKAPGRGLSPAIRIRSVVPINNLPFKIWKQLGEDLTGKKNSE